MKKFLVLAIAFAVLFGGMASATVVGSLHDLSATGGLVATGDESDTGQICVFCHTPHNSITTVRPLWNKTITTTATFGVYGSTTDTNLSPTMDSVPVDVTSGYTTTTGLCLGCHDGVNAVNTLSNDPNDIAADPTHNAGTELTAGVITNAIYVIGGGATELYDDHPINMDYTAAGAAMQTNYVAGPPENVGGLPLYTGSTVQCASCHDPHDAAGLGESFLRLTMTGSALCIVCHDDK